MVRAGEVGVGMHASFEQTDYTPEVFARPWLAAGALFVREESLFLVHKTYGDDWDIPGGFVDVSEAPVEACRREIAQELGIARVPRRLLVCDWSPHDGTDRLLFVFDCGELGDESAVVLQDSELDRWEWVPIAALEDYVAPRLAIRLQRAYAAYHEGGTEYLERGEPVPAD
ncbi:NUDIX hydrolase [Nocardia sp. NEAU-G5]|uniref:NUDIX hydrolase n=1 Tax=Nocardia albiluteola TaxID=2842303 RepID=A0ABS6B1X6_9NOCA|nr:NUDIX hydrolase [Nocardia albiluteola]MBU3063751.1 NUDIX hydrolase [Nocardia albiluteola]